MKTLRVRSDDVTILRERGHGDGGVVLRYFVSESDGRFSGHSSWYSDPAEAQLVYDEDKSDYLRWVVDEARRLTIAPDSRPAQEAMPDQRTR